MIENLRKELEEISDEIMDVEFQLINLKIKLGILIGTLEADDVAYGDLRKEVDNQYQPSKRIDYAEEAYQPKHAKEGEE